MCRFPSAVASDVVVCGFSRDTFIYSPPSDAAAAAVSCGIRKPLNLTRRLLTAVPWYVGWLVCMTTTAAAVSSG